MFLTILSCLGGFYGAAVKFDAEDLECSPILCTHYSPYEKGDFPYCYDEDDKDQKDTSYNGYCPNTEDDDAWEDKDGDEKKYLSQYLAALALAPCSEQIYSVWTPKNFYGRKNEDKFKDEYDEYGSPHGPNSIALIVSDSELSCDWAIDVVK